MEHFLSIQILQQVKSFSQLSITGEDIEMSKLLKKCQEMSLQCVKQQSLFFGKTMVDIVRETNRKLLQYEKNYKEGHMSRAWREMGDDIPKQSNKKGLRYNTLLGDEYIKEVHNIAKENHAMLKHLKGYEPQSIEMTDLSNLVAQERVVALTSKGFTAQHVNTFKAGKNTIAQASEKKKRKKSTLGEDDDEDSGAIERMHVVCLRFLEYPYMMNSFAKSFRKHSQILIDKGLIQQTNILMISHYGCWIANQLGTTITTHHRNNRQGHCSGMRKFPDKCKRQLSYYMIDNILEAFVLYSTLPYDKLELLFKNIAPELHKKFIEEHDGNKASIGESRLLHVPFLKLFSDKSFCFKTCNNSYLCNNLRQEILHKELQGANEELLEFLPTKAQKTNFGFLWPKVGSTFFNFLAIYYCYITEIIQDPKVIEVTPFSHLQLGLLCATTPLLSDNVTLNYKMTGAELQDSNFNRDNADSFAPGNRTRINNKNSVYKFQKHLPFSPTGLIKYLTSHDLGGFRLLKMSSYLFGCVEPLTFDGKKYNLKETKQNKTNESESDNDEDEETSKEYDLSELFELCGLNGNEENEKEDDSGLNGNEENEKDLKRKHGRQFLVHIIEHSSKANVKYMESAIKKYFHQDALPTVNELKEIICLDDTDDEESDNGDQQNKCKKRGSPSSQKPSNKTRTSKRRRTQNKRLSM